MTGTPVFPLNVFIISGWVCMKHGKKTLLMRIQCGRAHYIQDASTPLQIEGKQTKRIKKEKLNILAMSNDIDWFDRNCCGASSVGRTTQSHEPRPPPV